MTERRTSRRFGSAARMPIRGGFINFHCLVYIRKDFLGTRAKQDSRVGRMSSLPELDNLPKDPPTGDNAVIPAELEQAQDHAPAQPKPTLTAEARQAKLAGSEDGAAKSDDNGMKQDAKPSADDVVREEWDVGGPPPPAPTLKRNLSLPSPTLLAEGVPAYILRRAAALVGSDEGKQRRFILANIDQPDDFWHSLTHLVSRKSDDHHADEGQAHHGAHQTQPRTLQVSSRFQEDEGVDKMRFAQDSSCGGSWVEALRIEPAYSLLQSHATQDRGDAGGDSALATASAMLADLSTGDVVDVNVAISRGFASGAPGSYERPKVPSGEACVPVWVQGLVTHGEASVCARYRPRLPVPPSSEPQYFKGDWTSHGWGETLFVLFVDPEGGTNNECLFPPGTKVEAKYKSMSNWYMSKIEAINADGTYVIQYDDGDHGASVPAIDVRLVGAPVPDPATVGRLVSAHLKKLSVSASDVSLRGQGYCDLGPFVVSGQLNPSSRALDLTFSSDVVVWEDGAEEARGVPDLKISKLFATASTKPLGPSAKHGGGLLHGTLRPSWSPSLPDNSATAESSASAADEESSFTCQRMSPKDASAFLSTERSWRVLHVELPEPLPGTAAARDLPLVFPDWNLAVVARNLRLPSCAVKNDAAATASSTGLTRFSFTDLALGAEVSLRAARETVIRVDWGSANAPVLVPLRSLTTGRRADASDEAEAHEASAAPSAGSAKANGRAAEEPVGSMQTEAWLSFGRILGNPLPVDASTSEPEPAALDPTATTAAAATGDKQVSTVTVEVDTEQAEWVVGTVASKAAWLDAAIYGVALAPSGPVDGTEAPVLGGGGDGLASTGVDDDNDWGTLDYDDGSVCLCQAQKDPFLELTSQGLHAWSLMLLLDESDDDTDGDAPRVVPGTLHSVAAAWVNSVVASVASPSELVRGPVAVCVVNDPKPPFERGDPAAPKSRGKAPPLRRLPRAVLVRVPAGCEAAACALFCRLSAVSEGPPFRCRIVGLSVAAMGAAKAQGSKAKASCVRAATAHARSMLDGPVAAAEVTAKKTPGAPLVAISRRVLPAALVSSVEAFLSTAEGAPMFVAGRSAGGGGDVEVALCVAHRATRAARQRAAVALLAKDPAAVVGCGVAVEALGDKKPATEVPNGGAYDRSPACAPKGRPRLPRDLPVEAQWRGG